MGKKEKHPLINGYKQIKEINQVLKEISSAYIFDTTGLTIIGNPDDLGYEKIAIIDPSAMELVAPYSNMLINSAEMFQFTKAARVTTLECLQESNSITLLDPAHSVEIKLNSYSDIAHPFSLKDIHQLGLAQKFFVYPDLQDPMQLITKMDDFQYVEDSIISEIKSNEVVWVPAGDFTISLSREIFPTISKCDLLRYYVVAKKGIIALVLFEETYYDLMKIYTIMGFLDYSM